MMAARRARVRSAGRQGARALILALAFLAGVILVDPAAADNAAPTPSDALARLFAPQPIQAAWFAPAFLSQVPVPRIEQIVRRLVDEHGGFRGVAGSDRGIVVRLERAEVPTQIALDHEGRITGLLFQNPIPTAGGIDDYVRTIAALPGETAVLVLTDGKQRAARAADKPLAVGSAFKLAVIKALADQVAAGHLAWEKVVSFDPTWRSLPSGILQDWPAGTPLTIATLANLMISISDNTATDALIHLVGREPIEAISPRNHPFLTTREAFDRKATAAGEPTPETSMRIEWFFTAGEICSLLEATHDLPPFRINPGLADARDWQSVAYKGGSEPGVLNFSTYLTGRDGSTYCVVATWNDAADLDEASLATPYRGLLRALRRP